MLSINTSISGVAVKSSMGTSIEQKRGQRERRARVRSLDTDYIPSDRPENRGMLYSFELKRNQIDRAPRQGSNYRHSSIYTNSELPSVESKGMLYSFEQWRSRGKRLQRDAARGRVQMELPSGGLSTTYCARFVAHGYKSCRDWRFPDHTLNETIMLLQMIYKLRKMQNRNVIHAAIGNTGYVSTCAYKAARRQPLVASAVVAAFMCLMLFANAAISQVSPTVKTNVNKFNKTFGKTFDQMQKGISQAVKSVCDKA